MGCIEGYFIGLEVKVPGRGNTVTKLQEKTLSEIRKAQGYATVVQSVEEAETAVIWWLTKRVVD